MTLNWAVSELPLKDEKRPGRLFLYWGYMRVHNKECYQAQSMYILSDTTEEILVAVNTRVLLVYT